MNEQPANIWSELNLFLDHKGITDPAERSKYRVGLWGQKPRSGEIQVGNIRIRSGDPIFPIYYAKHK